MTHITLSMFSAKLVEVGYGIKKLQIGCVVEDEKIGIEDLSEEITTEFEDNVSCCITTCETICDY